MGGKIRLSVVVAILMAGSLSGCISFTEFAQWFGLDFVSEEEVIEISMEKPWFYSIHFWGNEYRVYDKGRYIATLEKNSFSVTAEAFSMLTLRAEATESETNAQVDLYRGNARRVGWDPKSPYEGMTAQQLRQGGLLTCADDFILPDYRHTDQYQGAMPRSGMIYALEMKSIEGKVQMVPLSFYWSIAPICTTREECSLPPSTCALRERQHQAKMQECRDLPKTATRHARNKCEQEARELIPPKRTVSTTGWISEVFWTAWDENRKDLLRPSHLVCKELLDPQSRSKCEEIQAKSSGADKSGTTPVGFRYITLPHSAVGSTPNPYRSLPETYISTWKEPASALIAYLLQHDELIYQRLISFKDSHPEEYRKLRLENKLYQKFPLIFLRDPADAEISLSN